MAAPLINLSPLRHVPAHNCVVWTLFYDGISSYPGSQASATITFDSGGTATTGTVIYFCGQSFTTDGGLGLNDGYGFNYNGLSGNDRAAAFLETLNANLFFSPDKVTFFIAGNSVSVTFNQVGAQSNWSFSDGGITQISFIEFNGDNQVYNKNSKFIHTIYKDMSLFSVPDIKLTPEKEAPVLFIKDYAVSAPATEIYVPTPVDYSNELQNLVSTHIPSIYNANYIPYQDSTFSLDIYLRVGYTKTVDCQTRSFLFGNSDLITVYNSLFQKEKYTEGANLMQPYVNGGALMLIKNRYEICRSTNFAVWTALIGGYRAIETVYYDSSGSVLETASSVWSSESQVNYTNVGSFGNTPPVDCDHYIVNFTNSEDEVIAAVRFDLINCGCVDGELIFLSDLGAYETFLLTNNTRTELTVSSDTVQGFDGCNVFSLQQGGRSIVNKQTEKVYTYETYIDTSDPNELEYVSQLLRSQSVFLKVFINDADAYFYVKIIPENTNFVPLETGKRAVLTYSFRFNQAYKSHPQNEAVFI